MTEQSFQKLGRQLDSACENMENTINTRLIRQAEALVFRIADLMVRLLLLIKLQLDERAWQSMKRSLRILGSKLSPLRIYCEHLSLFCLR